MKKDISRYFSELGSMFLKVQVADSSGKSIELADALEKAINLIASRTSKGCKVIFIGNGGSASIASHQAIDFFKNGGMRAICFNDSSLLTCISNDFKEVYCLMACNR